MNIKLLFKVFTISLVADSTSYAILQEGSDGRIVYSPGTIPWTTKQGADGRIISYPSGVDWKVKEGSDGRVIVYPNNLKWTAMEGSDGRIVPYPNSINWNVREGSDGRLVPYKSSDYYAQEGGDGRIISYPKWIGQKHHDFRTLILIEIQKLHDDIDILTILKFMGFVDDFSGSQKNSIKDSLTYEQGRIDGLEIAFDEIEKNPSLFGYVKKSEHEREIEDIISILTTNATHYTEGWFYHPSRGWMWTDRSAYPYFYDATDKDWMYFQSGNEKPKFYRYKTKTWLTVE